MHEEEKEPQNSKARNIFLLGIADKIGSIGSAVFAILSYFAGNHWILYFWIIVFCLFVDWLLYNTYAWFKKPGRLIIAKESGELIQSVGKTITWPMAAVIMFMVIFNSLGLGWTAVNAYQDIQRMQAEALLEQGYYAPTATPNEQLILLAEFDSSGSKKYDTTRRIRERLEEELQKAGATNVRLVVTPKVGTKEEARALGERHKATVVIWGWYDDIGITPNFTIIKAGKRKLPRTELAQVVAEPARDFAIYVSQGLPEEMSYFALVTIGQLYNGDEQFDRALGALDAAVAISESRSAKGIPLPSGTAGLYFYRGFLYQTAKVQLDQAIADYTRSIELNPEIPSPYVNRAIAYADKGDFDQALTDWTKAIELDPNDPDTYYNRAIAYSGKDNFDQAITDYTKAIELDPKDADAYYSRGNAYARRGNFDQAIADYTKAVELDPKDPGAYTNRGNSHSAKGNLDQAIVDFTRAIELDPKYGKAYYNRGNAYARKGNLDQAIADYGKAIELDPGSADAYNNRGIVYRDKRNLNKAIADYSKAIELEPNDPTAYYNRGIAYGLEGMKPEAIADFQMYLQILPDASNRALVEQFIRGLQ